jgi:hypothetical protein
VHGCPSKKILVRVGIAMPTTGIAMKPLLAFLLLPVTLERCIGRRWFFLAGFSRRFVFATRFIWWISGLVFLVSAGFSRASPPPEPAVNKGSEELIQSSAGTISLPVNRAEAGETIAEIEPQPLDSDRDGVPDSVEIEWHMDPLDVDTDDDGLPDGEEFYGGCGEGTSYPCAGLVDAAERYWLMPMTLFPTRPDSDGDGIPDGTEVGVTEAIHYIPPDPPRPAIAGTDTSATFEFKVIIGDGPAPLDTSTIVPMEYISQTRYCFRADADPETITNPVNLDTNGDLILDGASDFDPSDPSNYNKSTNYNGRVDFDQGEVDPVFGFYSADPSSPAHESGNLIYVARRTSLVEELHHEGGWGSVMPYYFNFGSSNFERLEIEIEPNGVVYAIPKTIARDCSRNGVRTTVVFLSNSTETSDFRVLVFDSFNRQDGPVLDVSAFIGAPKPLGLSAPSPAEESE